jgi:hypothetical protein
MPIKFRCQHCRQFLGISRTKAGDVVDCPTCGRSVRVPNLDGTVAPVPEPRLNVHELAGALDELARIGEAGAADAADEPADEFAPAPKPTVVKELAPLPRPEPISLEPPPVAVPVDIHAKQARPAAEERHAVDATPRVGSEQRPAAVSFPAVLRSWPVIGVLLASALAAFAGGWIAGGMGSSGPPEQPGPVAGGGKPGGARPAPATKLVPVYHPESWKTAVKGQITYHTSDGKHRPDEGARILILPETREGGLSKLPVAGFWSAANDADFRVAVAGLRELGGNAALAGPDGNFAIKLPPSSGSYHVLVISAFKENDLDTALLSSTSTLLAAYFDRPEALIRKLAFKHGRLKYDGSKVEPWNHSFE